MPELLDHIRRLFKKSTTKPTETVSSQPPSDVHANTEHPFRRVSLKDITDIPDRHRIIPPTERFSRYEFFTNPDTFKLWFRNQHPDWIALNIANATYVQGVNVDPSNWLAERKTAGNGMVIELDPNLDMAAQAHPPKHTGNPRWADRFPDVQPVMVSATTTQVLEDLRGKVDAAAVIAPAPLYRTEIITDAYTLLKSGGELLVVFDPIISAEDPPVNDPDLPIEHPPRQPGIKASLVDELLSFCPNGTDIRLNGVEYHPGDPLPHLDVYGYKSEGKFPRTAYINDSMDYDAPVLVFQVKKPSS